MKKYLLTLSLLGSSVLFAEDAEPVKQTGGYMQTLIMIGVALVFFYFILLRPEQKRRKAAERLRNSLKKKDKVTAMGLIGTVDQVKDNTVILKMVDGAKVEVLKAAITDVQPSVEESTEKNEASSTK